MAKVQSCLHSLQQLRSCALTLTSRFPGRCIRSLQSRQPGTAATASHRHQPLAAPPAHTNHASPISAGCFVNSVISFPRTHLRPDIRDLHSSSIVCAAKKNAEDLVRRITKDDVQMSFSRSGGAGGQNVNKVNTKAEVRLRLDDATWLPDDMKEALREKYKNRINNEGEFVVTSQRTRTQGGNLDDAMEKLQSYIDNAALAVQPIEEDPVKRKKLEKQKKKANENRLQEKKLKSMKKGDRRNKGKGDW